MDRVNRVLSHPLWQTTMARLTELEKDREFCRHGLDHLLNVARLAYIENLEKDLAISKSLIYSAALLHDLGRAAQYEKGIPHHEAGAQLAALILPDCGYCAREIRQICEAIACHRSENSGLQNDLSGILYRADKASRLCLFCSARSGCNWSDEKKNLSLKV